MLTFRVRLRLHGPVGTPLLADTLFGGLCWALLYNEGDKELERFLERYRAGDPPLIISNGFPGDLFPRPFAPLISIEDPAVDPLARYQESKRRKSMRYLTREGFDAFCRNEPVTLVPQRPWVEKLIVRNRINRWTGRAADRGGLFPETELYLNEGFPYLTVFARVTEGWEEIIRNAFMTLGHMGLGRRRSVGRGHFSVLAWEEMDALGCLSGANGFISLSDFVPAPSDPSDGWWGVSIKYGKLSEGFGLTEMPFKRSLLMLRAGSCFRVAGPIKPFYGRMVPDMVPALPQVMHYGLALAVPILLPEGSF